MNLWIGYDHMCINLSVPPLIWIKIECSHNVYVILFIIILSILGSYGRQRQAERLGDLRDEEMVLRKDDALGELPEELQYESLF